METKHITKYVAPRHLEMAHNLATRMGRAKISERFGMQTRVVHMKETISEKAKRILAACDAVVCKK